MTKEPTPLIDHPSQPNWGVFDSESALDTDYIATLQSRFPDYPRERVEWLAQTLGRFMTVIDNRRQNYEAATRGYLQLNDEELQEYSQLAGRYETAGEFLHWFSRHSDAFFRHASGLHIPKKIGLEIGATRQFNVAADWNITRVLGGLDETIETIPDSIRESTHETKLDVHFSAGAIKQYTYKPLYVGEYETEIGLAQRKRSVADIQIGDSERPLKIFKCGWFGIYFGGLTGKDYATVERAVMASHSGSEIAKAKSIEYLNGLIGQIIEQAITGLRERSPAVFPLRASYVMFKSLAVEAPEERAATTE